jgi:hypothetical protein
VMVRPWHRADTIGTTEPTACYPVSARPSVTYREIVPLAAVPHPTPWAPFGWGCKVLLGIDLARDRSVWCGEAGIRFHLHDEAADPAAASAFVVLCTQYAGVWTVAGDGKGYGRRRAHRTNARRCGGSAIPIELIRPRCATRRTRGCTDGRTVWLIYSRTGRARCTVVSSAGMACTCGRPVSMALLCSCRSVVSRLAEHAYGVDTWWRRCVPYVFVRARQLESECREDTEQLVRLGLGGVDPWTDGRNRIAVLSSGARRDRRPRARLWRLVHATQLCAASTWPSFRCVLRGEPHLVPASANREPPLFSNRQDTGSTRIPSLKIRAGLPHRASKISVQIFAPTG